MRISWSHPARNFPSTQQPTEGCVRLTFHQWHKGRICPAGSSGDVWTWCWLSWLGRRLGCWTSSGVGTRGAASPAMYQNAQDGPYSQGSPSPNDQWCCWDTPLYYKETEEILPYGIRELGDLGTYQGILLMNTKGLRCVCIFRDSLSIPSADSFKRLPSCCCHRLYLNGRWEKQKRIPSPAACWKTGCTLMSENWNQRQEEKIVTLLLGGSYHWQTRKGQIPHLGSKLWYCFGRCVSDLHCLIFIST